MDDMKYDNVNDLVLIGAGGHALVIIETLIRYYSQYKIIGIADKDQSRIGQSILGIPIIGTDGILESLYKSGIRKAFVSIGAVDNFKPRLNTYNLAVITGFELINVFHGRSVISDQTIIGSGNAVLANAVINTGTKIGNNCIINTGSIVEHQCEIGDNVHIAPGSVVCGGATIASNCLVGAGSTVIQGVRIGENSIIGAGSVVLKDIPPNSVAVGVPARIIGKR